MFFAFVALKNAESWRTHSGMPSNFISASKAWDAAMAGSISAASIGYLVFSMFLGLELDDFGVGLLELIVFGVS